MVSALVETIDEDKKMGLTYTVDIADTPKGTYTKVRNLLDDHTTPWTYAKPVFTLEDEVGIAGELAEDLEEIGLSLGGYDPSVEHDDDEEEVEEEEAAPAPVAPAPAPAPAPTPPMYTAYCCKGGMVFSRRGAVDADDAALLARHAADGVTHIDIHDGSGVRTIHA